MKWSTRPRYRHFAEPVGGGGAEGHRGRGTDASRGRWEDLVTRITGMASDGCHHLAGSDRGRSRLLRRGRTPGGPRFVAWGEFGPAGRRYFAKLGVYGPADAATSPRWVYTARADAATSPSRVRGGPGVRDFAERACGIEECRHCGGVDRRIEGRRRFAEVGGRGAGGCRHFAAPASGRAAEWPEGPSGRAVERPSGRVVEWPEGPSGRAAERPSGRVAEWPSGRVAEGSSGRVAERPSDRAAERPSTCDRPEAGRVIRRQYGEMVMSAWLRYGHFAELALLAPAETGWSGRVERPR